MTTPNGFSIPGWTTGVPAFHVAQSAEAVAATQALKEEREAAKLLRQETMDELDARLGYMCELCSERSLDTTEFGGSLSYNACTDVYACESRRKEKMQTLMDDETQIREAMTRRA